MARYRSRYILGMASELGCTRVAALRRTVHSLSVHPDRNGLRSKRAVQDASVCGYNPHAHLYQSEEQA